MIRRMSREGQQQQQQQQRRLRQTILADPFTVSNVGEGDYLP